MFHATATFAVWYLYFVDTSNEIWKTVIINNANINFVCLHFVVYGAIWKKSTVKYVRKSKWNNTTGSSKGYLPTGRENIVVKNKKTTEKWNKTPKGFNTLSWLVNFMNRKHFGSNVQLKTYYLNFWYLDKATNMHILCVMSKIDKTLLYLLYKMASHNSKYIPQWANGRNRETKHIIKNRQLHLQLNY